MPISDTSMSDQDAINEALALAQAEAEANSQQHPTVGQDITQTAPSYLARGAAGVADAVTGASPAGMIAQGADWLRSPAGTGGNPISEIANSVAPDFMSREAQTTPGKFAGAVAEGLPYAAMGGGAAGRSLLTNVVGSLGGEAAAESIPQDSILAPFARLIGTVGAGGLTAGRPGNIRPGVRAANKASNSMKPWKNQPMTEEALKTATDGLYQTLRDHDIHYDPKVFQSLGDEMTVALEKAGKRGRRSSRADPRQQKAFDYADDMKRLSGTSPDFSDLETTSSELGQAIRKAYQPGPSQDMALGKALEIVQDHLDDFMKKAPLQTMPNLQGNAAKLSQAEINATREMANDLALRNIKSRRIKEALSRADDDKAGFVTGLNREFNALVERPYNRKLFSDAERKMISNVASGKAPMTMLSKFGFDFGHPGALSNLSSAAWNAGIGGAAAYALGPTGLASVALPILGVGSAAKTWGEPVMKRRNANAVAETIRGFEGQAPNAGLAGKALDTVKQDTNWAKLRWLMLGGQGSAPDGQQVSTAPRG